MSSFDPNSITPDENRIAKIVMSIAGVGVLLALGLVMAFGWRNGGVPLWTPCRPEIVTLARWVMDAGFIIAAFVLGVPEPSRTPNLRFFGPVAMIFVVCIAFGVSGGRSGHGAHLDTATEIQFWAYLILPTAAFGLANLIRIVSTRT